jgi:putative exosortase-associated protein (TIGR04073 family)
MNKRIGTILAVLLFNFFLAGVFLGEAQGENLAENKEETVKIEEKTQKSTPFHKLGRGLKNIVIAPLEIPWAMAETGKDNPFAGITIGALEGVGNCITRMTAGVVESVLFPFPLYDRPMYDLSLGETILRDKNLREAFDVRESREER